jgi:hypothetical protein
LIDPLFQDGEEVEHVGQIRLDPFPVAPVDPSPQVKVLVDAHLRKDLLVLRAIGDPRPDNEMGLHVVDASVGELAETLPRLDQTGDGLQQGALSGAVRPEDTDEFPLTDLERDVGEGLRLAVIG